MLQHSKTTFVTVNLDSLTSAQSLDLNSKTTFVTVNQYFKLGLICNIYNSKTTFVTVNLTTITKITKVTLIQKQHLLLLIFTY